jgi:7-carboxy-7-deazaguanine synthase
LPTKIVVHETFSTIQGEALNTGRPTTFVRVVGCNLSCFYCDTGYRPQDNRALIPREDYTVNELVQRILYLKNPYVCFTGGEPLLYQDLLWNVIEKLSLHPLFQHNGIAFNFETNGAVEINRSFLTRKDYKVAYTMDIKPFVFKKHKDTYEHNLDVLDSTCGDEVKIVIASESDLLLADKLINEHRTLDFVLSPIFDLDGKTFLTSELICDYIKDTKYPNVRIGIQTHKMLGQQ